jgi:hypothetical protein
MHKHRTPQGLAEHDHIDRALLELMLGNEHQRPWAEDELARAVDLPGDVRDGLRRLRASRLIHRWNDLVSPSRPAVRLYEVTQDVDPPSTGERHDDRAALEYLLAHSAAGGAPLTGGELYEAFGGDERLAITNALGRLDGDGLIERRGGRVKVSEVAQRFDELIKL